MLIIQSLILAVFFLTQIAVLAAPIPLNARALNGDEAPPSSTKRKAPPVAGTVCLDDVTVTFTLKFTVAPESNKRQRRGEPSLIYQRVLGH